MSRGANPEVSANAGRARDRFVVAFGPARLHSSLGIRSGGMKFRVESFFEVDEHLFLLVRRMEQGPFSVSAAARLSGVLIRQFVEQPRKLRPDGSPDLDVFVFELADRQDKGRFTAGQMVELQS